VPETLKESQQRVDGRMMRPKGCRDASTDKEVVLQKRGKGRGKQNLFLIVAVCPKALFRHQRE
jgi:hypothetical protein